MKSLDALRALEAQAAARPLDPEAWDPEKPSRALVACDGGGNGVVLWWVGLDLWVEMETPGLALEELGLDDAPLGLSVWEGRYDSVPCDPFDDAMMSRPVGTFRDLTAPEAEAVLARRNPWNPADWKMGARQPA